MYFIKIEGTAYLYDDVSILAQGYINPNSGNNTNKVWRDLSEYCPAKGTVTYKASANVSSTSSTISCSESETVY